jgi:bifunctional UDP-N-acetylglucosamine pyrophosphorylase/glucosamine-1-phosphate N-acetyltransferase
MPNDVTAVVMAAGLGTRMKSATPKHLHPLLGRRLVDWVVAAAQDAGVERVVVVTSPDAADAFGDLEVAVQEQPRGTGDAVRAARGALEGFEGDVLVLNGDVPGLSPQTVQALLETHRSAGAAGTVLAFEPDDVRSYGRIVRHAGGGLAGIVEAKDATPSQLEIREVNSGIYCFRADTLWPLLDRLQPQNAQGELYVTDTLGMLVEDGEPVAVHTAETAWEVEGINTRVELAFVAAKLRDRINEAHMLNGVTIVDPDSTWIEAGVEIEPDVTIHPFTVIRGDVRIATGVEVGPFAYVRPGTRVDERAKVGTFAEIKKSHIGAGAKVPHLSYIGDAEIGEGTNIGAGGVTANFKHQAGLAKQKTTIGRNVRTGIHNVFDAPVTIGDDAWIAPGSVITDDVPPGSLAGFPPRQETKEGWVYDKHGKPDS